MTRRERLRLIRADLAARLESGELVEIAAAREPYHPPEHWVTVTSFAGHVRSLLAQAHHVETAGPEWRGSFYWRQRGEWVAAQLEHVAAWVATAS